MVYTGPLSATDQAKALGGVTYAEAAAGVEAFGRSMRAHAVSMAFADLDDPEYEWAREQMALVGVELPEVRLRMRCDPSLTMRYER